MLVKYNMKIIFKGKFIWFVLIATFYFLIALIFMAYQGTKPSESTIYNTLIIPSLLLIFYPTVYGIQNDADNKMLEIIFSIPNYMYKVWLLRLIFVFVQCFLVILFLCTLAYLLFCPIPILDMAFNLMFPVFFSGTFAFVLSTRLKSGNATAFVYIFCMLIISLFSSAFSISMWNLFINPYYESVVMHPLVWQDTLLKNKLLIAAISLGFTLLGMLRLQKRESLL